MEDIKSTQDIGLLERYYVDVFFRHYADFSGRLSRKQFWMAYLFYVVSLLPLYALDMLIGFPVLSSVYSLVTLVPLIAFVVRRLHDAGKSGWWYLIVVVPLVGVIWLLVLLCRKGETVNIPARAKTGDWIGLVVALLVSAVGFAVGAQHLKKGLSDIDEAVESSMLQDEDSGAMDNDSGEGNTEEGTLVGVSTSGRYEYYLKAGDNTLYQHDTETETVYTISLEKAFDNVVVYSIEDCVPFGDKLVFITNNGALGEGNANDAFYLNMDEETWHYICFGKHIQFNEDRTGLQVSSPTDEGYEDFEEQEIDLSDL